MLLKRAWTANLNSALTIARQLGLFNPTTGQQMRIVAFNFRPHILDLKLIRKESFTHRPHIVRTKRVGIVN
jgi:hypothetical protein